MTCTHICTFGAQTHFFCCRRPWCTNTFFCCRKPWCTNTSFVYKLMYVSFCRRGVHVPVPVSNKLFYWKFWPLSLEILLNFNIRKSHFDTFFLPGKSHFNTWYEEICQSMHIKRVWWLASMKKSSLTNPSTLGGRVLPATPWRMSRDLAVAASSVSCEMFGRSVTTKSSTLPGLLTLRFFYSVPGGFEN
jgi:hypothetical protein